MCFSNRNVTVSLSQDNDHSQEHSNSGLVLGLWNEGTYIGFQLFFPSVVTIILDLATLGLYPKQTNSTFCDLSFSFSWIKFREFYEVFLCRIGFSFCYAYFYYAHFELPIALLLFWLHCSNKHWIKMFNFIFFFGPRLTLGADNLYFYIGE